MNACQCLRSVSRCCLHISILVKRLFLLLLWWRTKLTLLLFVVVFCRMLLTQALTQQAGAHSKLEQKLLERKRKRSARERLSNEISGHVDVTEIGGLKTSLDAMKHRNKLKEATDRLLEARNQVAMMREHVGFKKGIAGVKDERNARIALEEQEEAARGMAVLEAQQAAARRKSELVLEAEIESARIHAVSGVSFDRSDR